MEFYKEDLSLTLSLRTSDLSPPFEPTGFDGSLHEIMRDMIDDDEANGKKKLRLSKLQTSTLEDAFKQHHTLNTKEKMALSNQLNLRPRQVEVWFQNRRARMKLKKTEVEREMLKRCCESLSEENRRLQKEIMELRALKRPRPLQNLPMQFNRGGGGGGIASVPGTAVLAICPSCGRDNGGGGGGGVAPAVMSLPVHRRRISHLF